MRLDSRRRTRARGSVKLVATLRKDALEGGAHVRVAYPPFDVLVALVHGVPMAIEDACNHAGASLAPGPRTKDGKCIVCPVHGYVFELETGRLRSPRGLCGDQRTFVVKEEDSETISIWDTFELSVVPTTSPATPNDAR